MAVCRSDRLRSFWSFFGLVVVPAILSKYAMLLAVWAGAVEDAEQRVAGGVCKQLQGQ